MSDSILDKVEEITSKLRSEGCKLFILQRARRAFQEGGHQMQRPEMGKDYMFKDHETRVKEVCRTW